ncbi:hypothetical protein PHYPSEUDO_008618 [Phytophthora pseudosyringae]|uniref:Uncharacterized protein n=1 Tax=Phytophthora pseudosyringae TaxID=221518 RepID=A0A8T1WD33_9STRA|nr:hypothetical protein PHYPSEUDO_008618 [Phytophthora pseudosyringae]
MARTKNTARILRAIQLERESSSDEDSVAISANSARGEVVESTSESASDSLGIPPAQGTETLGDQENEEHDAAGDEKEEDKVEEATVSKGESSSSESEVESRDNSSLHSVNSTGCKELFVAQLSEKSGKWRVQVNLAFYGHNHPISPEVYEAYPSVRRLPASSPIMSDVELMVASGSKASRLYDYIRGNSPHRMQMQGMYNLITKIKKSGLYALLMVAWCARKRDRCYVML